MQTKNVNKARGGFAVTSEKYDTVRKAILAAVPRRKEGIAYKELVSAVGKRVPVELFPKKGSVSWYTKVVKLDLEAKGSLERIPGVSPQRPRRKPVRR